MDWLTKVEQLEDGDAAQQVVAAIARDVQNRKNIGNAFEGMDDDVRCDMLDGWVAKARIAMKDAGVPSTVRDKPASGTASPS